MALVSLHPAYCCPSTGFDWDARVAMVPFLPVRVRDAYVAGEGILHDALAGVVTVADLRGAGEVVEGELMRFLAEAAWYPTALLPSPDLSWTALGDRSARATLVDGPNAVSLQFDFDAQGSSPRSAPRRAAGPSAARQCPHHGPDGSGTMPTAACESPSRRRSAGSRRKVHDRAAHRIAPETDDWRGTALVKRA